MSILFYIGFSIVFVFLLGCSAFFSASETVLLSLTPLQVQQINRRSPKDGKRLQKLLNRHDVMLSTILVGNTVVNALIGSLGYTFFATTGWLPKQYVEIATIASVTLLVLLFGEISPKQFAVTHVEMLAPKVSRVVTWFVPVFSPITFIMRRLLRPLNKRLRVVRDAVTDDELLSVIELGQESGSIDDEEGEMVKGIMRLSQLNASDVMTPRVDILGLDTNDSDETWLEQARALPFERLPVWDDTPDNLIGFLDVASYIMDVTHNRRNNITSKHIFQPENIGLDDLLIFFYGTHQRVVCLVDEYGGTAGLVTRGDILEVLSADMPDPDEAPEIVALSENKWRIDGAASLEQINFELGTHLDADDADRMAGWVTFHAKHIPVTGETIEADGYRVFIEKMRRRTIQAVTLTDLHPQSQHHEVNVDETGRSLDDDDGDVDSIFAEEKVEVTHES